MNGSNNQVRMDGETAMAFAGHDFEQRHPKQSCPDWLGRCTTIGYSKDQAGRFVVSFAVTPKATNDAVSYFKVAIDSVTAETEVLLDRDLADFSGEDLQGH
ncbi:hypothetical protein [Blastopirellula marina]|uniref:Uncharacterized protein n=1 Tax=Blastopirellula marina DSM 3645 TaxID=314230 RepID=A3ZWE8_9BACT|nr:hypothetical protein [Blastopirellula marina]EAQ79176.1 hypothetical protein DSM3645_26174 [Blastopirellula marina DSM 3645]